VLSLGFDEEYLARLPAAPRTTLTRYNLIAPFDGTVVEKHITLGEVLKPDSEAALFGVADLRTVWVDLHVPQIDLLRVQPGQHALVSAGDGIPPVACVIEYVGPVIGAETRTALARATIANTAGVYRPGLFVTARVALERVAVPVCVPSDAVQIVDGEPCVFIQQGHGFLPRPVVTGIRDDQFIQIHSGMNAGEPYVARGAFTLKAILATSGLDSHAGHGH
jgi:cobalt-zinc-cadmium efflux system membrane fusion protein